MFHPLLTRRRSESAGTMPEWVGVCLLFGGLVSSGWMAIAAMSLRAWVAGLLGFVLFVITLFVTCAHLFPEDRR
ncbi:MAG TPA: hypothetical protein VHT74_00280 [Acetobacteraceae bacterium]|jgi:hypothetical protein|nr:hypothetical protein [Acetobacteraceae bacterium]